MEWWAPGMAEAGRRVVETLRDADWDAPPPPFTLLGKRRLMRQVLRGRLVETGTAVVVKWNRQVTRTDVLGRRLRGGKGRREGRVLQALSERGIPVPEVLGFTEEKGTDLLVLAEIEGAASLPPWPHVPHETTAALGRLLGRAHHVGLRHRDLHRGNLVLQRGEPVLLDLGGAHLGRAGRGGLVDALARARHGLFGDASITQRWRALRAWLEAVGENAAPDRLRLLAAAAERRARTLSRRYRRGRDRRAKRSGRHFEAFSPEGGGRAMRRRDAPEQWRALCLSWIARDPAGARSLKGGGRVLTATLPPAATPAVLKRFERILPGRLPRPLRAFWMAAALENRGVDVPKALLAVSDATGAGVLVSERVDAPNLHDFTDGGRGGAYGASSRRARRGLLERLGRTLRQMHDAEVAHRDLKAPNLLVRREPGGSYRFLVTDLEGARVGKGPIGWRRRARDLARLDASLGAPATDRLRVFRAYWRVHPRPPVPPRTVLAWIAEAVAQKRGPSGEPR